ncbi:PqqD family protein [Plebeiibacterium sediminum]|uniref:PqqD family protein n=1 Tax=Plebeiibacterium sediminum TaxID=2992112 RepID=A0AAE3SF83_9BACT|nr:PqqD family protein [Plebeiobacterium sediminum]MCW3785913.1 PqqD family protein [Plebeiobacterium sediminum]
MDFSKVYCKSERFVEKSIGNEKVLVPLTDNVADMNHVLTLNEVGTFLYDQVNGEKSVSDILSLLLEEYDVSNEIAKKDIEQFINNTVSKGILFEKQ